MAANNSQTALCERFNPPSDPSPMASMDDLDEESFVFLDEDDSPITAKKPVSLSLEQITEMTREGRSQMENVHSDVSNVSSGLNSGEMQEHFTKLIEENNILKKRICENNEIMESQCQKIASFQEYQKGVEDEMEMLKVINRNVIDELKELTAKDNAKNSEILALKRDLEEIIGNKDYYIECLEMTKKQLGELRKEHNKLMVESEQLRKKTFAQEKEVEALRQFLNELNEKKIVNEKKAKKEIVEVKMELAEVVSSKEKERESLTKELQNLRSQLLLANQRPSVEEHACIKEQLRATTVAKMHFEQDNVIANTHIESMNNEIHNLRMELNRWDQQKEELKVLRTQAELYKADYKVEKRSNRILESEKLQLSEDLKNQKTISLQFQEEINILREREAAHSCQQFYSEPVPIEQSLTCPVCHSEFTLEEALRHHVERCLSAEQ